MYDPTPTKHYNGVFYKICRAHRHLKSFPRHWPRCNLKTSVRTIRTNVLCISYYASQSRICTFVHVVYVPSQPRGYTYDQDTEKRADLGHKVMSEMNSLIFPSNGENKTAP